jgi:hypothetical protein
MHARCFFIACLYISVIDRHRFVVDPDLTSILMPIKIRIRILTQVLHMLETQKKYFLEISIVKLYIWLKLIWIRQKDADPDLH